jgi:hypothetical protein
MTRRTDTPDLANPEQVPDPRHSQTAPAIDELDLGVDRDFREVDQQCVPVVLSRPKPRGLLPVPGEVKVIIAKEEARLLKEHCIVPTPEARQRMIDSFTLQYYFDGIDIAYRRTTQGVEVVAVGLEEVGELIRTRPQDQRADVVFGQG